MQRKPRTGPFRRLWLAAKLVRRRHYLIARAFRRYRDLTPLANRTQQIAKGDILVFMTCRNEALRLPYLLDHYRRLGVRHFLIVENDSTDETAALLRSQPDVSLWTTKASYKLSRFGMDWINALLQRFGHGHWCLTVDADEILIYPYWQTRPLPALTAWLNGQGIKAYPAMMLDLYPQGQIGTTRYTPGQDPTKVLTHFDSGNYVMRRQPQLKNLWIQGGPRARAFFDLEPRRAPTLGKTPLVKWNRRYAYVSSTHTLLPSALNAATYDEMGGEAPSGVLLHTKFLETIVAKSHEEKARREHFANSALYDEYYEALINQPDLWTEKSTRLTGWRQLEAKGLMSRGGWV